MGDAFSRPFLSEFEITPAQYATQDAMRLERITCTNKFLFALYKYLIDPTAAEKKVKVIKFAKDYGDIHNKPSLADQVKIVLPLLIRDHELAWIHLLCFISCKSDMFGQFKDISPFAEKIIGRMRFFHTSASSPGCVDTQSLPDTDCLWPLNSQSADVCRKISSIVVVFPRSAVISVYDLG